MNDSKKNLQKSPLVALVGPTAVGKTETALQLAERLNAEIVSADSRLFYRGMDIGTAKPTQAELHRIPHHLIDVADPDEVWSLGVYKRNAEKVIAEILSRRHLPLLVGGSGQYIRAILEGWDIPEVNPNQTLRQALERWVEQITSIGLHDRLAVLDVEAAAKIDPKNVRRTIRALEVILTTGRRFSQQKTRSDQPFSTFVLGLYRPRDELYQRIDQRIEAMFEAGFVTEVKNLLTRGFSPELPTLSAIGYSQVIAYLRNEISLEEAVQLIKRQTRIFVRRQANWFKLDDPNIHWVPAGPDAVGLCENMVNAWLKDLGKQFESVVE